MSGAPYITYVVGFGGEGQRFASELAEENGAGVEIVAVERCLPDEEVRTRHPRVRFETARDLGSIESADVLVVLAVPPSAVGVLLRQLADAAKAYRVVLEKPGPFPWGDTGACVESIERNGGCVFVCHQRQYASHFNEAAALIAQGGIGTPRCATVQLHKWDLKTAGTHWMAFTELCLGRVVNIRGSIVHDGATSSLYGYPIEITGHFVTSHEGGTETSWTLGEPGERSDFRCFGEGGYVELKTREDPLGRARWKGGSRVFTEYGHARARLCNALMRGDTPLIGCTVPDLERYLSLFQSLTLDLRQA